MSKYACNLGSNHFVFDSLIALMACASPRRSGDELAGIAAESDVRRVAARTILADLPLRTFLEEPLIPYEKDEVTRLIMDSHDAEAFALVSSMTVGQFREWLLSYAADAQTLAQLAPGLTPEMVSAVSKIMRNQDLMTVALKCQVTTGFRTTLGLSGCLGARLQPNHPTDDPAGIAAAIIDGLLYGMGDAVIGINPSSDNPASCMELLTMLDAVRCKFDIPTQSCVLTHVTNTMMCIERGAPVDLVFQSIAGTEAANSGFGVNLSMLAEANDAARSLKRGTVGNNVMYFETGQGSALSADAHHGVDQQTCEVRAYAVARAYEPFMVNTVVGFIGPEYLYDTKQIIRAGLEDHFCGKLMGLPMGVDVCYTNHAEADQDDMDTLSTLLASSGVNFVIGVPGADDIMLSYQSLSFHDILSLRHRLNLKPCPEFQAWLENMGMLDAKGRVAPLLNGEVAAPQLLAANGWPS